MGSAVLPLAVTGNGTDHGGGQIFTLLWKGESAGLAYNAATGATHLLAAEALLMLRAGNPPNWQQHWRAALDSMGVDADDEALRQWRDQLAAAGLIAC